MKRVVIPVAAMAAFALSASTFAADTSTISAVDTKAVSPTTLSAQIKKLKTETKKLEHEVWLLHAQMNKHHLHHVNVSKHMSTNESRNHFVTVTTTSFNGKKMEFDGADTLYNAPSINEDLLLLEQKQQLQNEISIDRPIVQLSGAIQGEMFSTGNFGTKATDGISLSTAEIDMNVIASSWATGFMSLNYNGAPVSTGNRAPLSTIYLSRGFVTIGDLNHCPVYFTAGLMYVPFGRYSNAMVSTPLTHSLFKMRSPAVLLGAQFNNGLFGSVYGYSGYRTSGGSDLVKQEGVNAGFKHTIGDNVKNNYSIGAGWISNVADSEGMQNNGLGFGNGAQFNGFGVLQTGSATSNNNLVHNVGGVDVNGMLTMEPITLIGEYLTATEHFATSDLTYDSNGAQPAAMHAEADYLLPWFAKKYGTTVGVAYDHTWQSVALYLPKDSYIAFVNTSLWRETQESLEYRHDTDYSSATTGSGRGATIAIAGTGKSRDSIVAQLSVFF